MRLGKHREPEEVFTPKTIVSREMFARRNEPDLDGNPGLQDSLRDALREQGGQVLIYGDTGVGKFPPPVRSRGRRHRPRLR